VFGFATDFSKKIEGTCMRNGKHARDGRSFIFLTPRPLRLRKVLLRIRSSSANHGKIQIRLPLDSAKLQVIL